jgi:hypothetical protein
MAGGGNHDYGGPSRDHGVPKAGAAPSRLIDRRRGGAAWNGKAVPPQARPPAVSSLPGFHTMYVIYMALGLLVGLPFAGIFYYAIWTLLTGDPGGSDHFL